MNNEATQVTSQSTQATQESRLAQIMDRYLVSLEQAAPLDVEALTEAHPELAAEIQSMASSLNLLHHATSQMRPELADQQPATGAKRLGDFEIDGEIGRGGMGVVYAARQISLQRKVALKVLPFAAMWDQKQIARFRNEALAAAQLHHPNIVPVFAVGEERGVHFYAMQYIDGRSLDQVVRELPTTNAIPPTAAATTALGHTTQTYSSPSHDKITQHLSTQHSHDQARFCQAIAQLGQQAARALHHAHEYGVVHRDIKPSNLMVDGRAKLWITDFGLARVQNSPGVTMTGDVVGTLRYMSPEQAAGQHALVDARTDLYSLGATLYELLTLQPAFPGEDRHAVLRDIEAQEPPSPRTINPAIPVDLETIVLQAMSKSRDSRYVTAAALADDLDRFLAGRPTLAQRPTLIDRTTKWMRRHRNMVAMAATFLVMLTLGSTVAAIKISREQERTITALAASERNLTRAQRHFAQARQVVDRFGIQLADQLQETPGTELLRQQLLVETLKYYRDFAQHIDGQLDVQDQLAMTHLKTGVVTAKLGANRRAMAEYQAAQRLLQQLLEQDPTNSQVKSQLALSRNNMALLFAAAGDRDSARREYDLAIVDQRQLVAESPANFDYTSQLAESHLNLGTLLGQTGENQAATESLGSAIEILRATYQAAPRNIGHGRSLAMAYNNLGYLQRKPDVTLAKQSAREAVDLLESICQTPKATTECFADLSLCYGNLAAIQAAADRTIEAVASYQRAVTIRESLVRKSPGVVRYRSELAANLNNLALLYIRIDNLQAASDAFGQANQLFAVLLEDYPNQVAYASGWAALLNNQGLALAKIERYEEAIQAYRQAVEVQARVWQQLSGSQSKSPKVRESLSRIYYNYSQALQHIGRREEAVEQTLARRRLWHDDGDRLFGVALELAQIIGNENQAESDDFDCELIATLASALQAGYQPQVPLSSDPRFRPWHEHPHYRKLVTTTDSELLSADGKTASTNL